MNTAIAAGIRTTMVLGANNSVIVIIIVTIIDIDNYIKTPIDT